jgi:hypothetical protein
MMPIDKLSMLHTKQLKYAIKDLEERIEYQEKMPQTVRIEHLFQSLKRNLEFAKQELIRRESTTEE